MRFGIEPGIERLLQDIALHTGRRFHQHHIRFLRSPTAIEGNGRVTARIVATQFAFVPRCLVIPEDQEVTLRLASPDVIHGILVTGTNVNTMVVPGYVSQVHTIFRTTGDLLMPCHEFCGLGHSQMLARVRVVPRDQFRADAQGRVSCDPQ
jgi:cytochrome c oxidase subunit 2